MSIDFLARMPDRFRAGDTVKVFLPYGDWDPASATATLTITGTPHAESVAGVPNASSSRWEFELTAAQSALFVPEHRYQWSMAIADGTERSTVDWGSVEVEPDLAAVAAGTDTRSWEERTLANIKAVLEGKANQDQATYAIAGRSLSTFSPEELMAWRDRLESIVAARARSDALDRGERTGGNLIAVRL